MSQSAHENTIQILIQEELSPNGWYGKYWRNLETDDFNKWWFQYHGGPEDVDCGNETDGIHEYFVRKSFALAGWLAAQVRFETQTNNVPEAV